MTTLPAQTHPELRKDELFLTNSNETNYMPIKRIFNSARMGVIAYNDKGEHLRYDLGLFPVFVNKWDFEQNKALLEENPIAWQWESTW